MARLELRFDLEADGGLERGYEMAQRINDPIESIHAKVEGWCLRVVLNYPEAVSIDALVERMQDGIRPDPDGKEFS